MPLGALVPLHSPDALHAVAFDELQTSVVALPAATTTGWAPSIAVGTTVTVALAVALAPPGPVHVRM